MTKTVQCPHLKSAPRKRQNRESTMKRENFGFSGSVAVVGLVYLLALTFAPSPGLSAPAKRQDVVINAEIHHNAKSAALRDDVT
jgi:uncharacterized protein involved in high-affinity Fe2+ transport